LWRGIDAATIAPPEAGKEGMEQNLRVDPGDAWSLGQWNEIGGTAPSATVLVVDSDPIGRQLFRGLLKASHYRILEAPGALEALAYLRSEAVDLVISDSVLRELSGIDLCRKMKSEKQLRLIPILLVSSVHGIEDEIAALESGADEYLVKPVSPMALRTRVRALLRTKNIINSLEEAESILFALARIVDSHDSDTGDHCQRLAHWSELTGAALGLPTAEMLALRQGSFLHDIGKVAIPDSILNKKGPLDAEEWTRMRQHTTIGESICRPMRSLRNALPIIRHHHERWDGSGYPDGLRGEQIPLLARVVQLADIYDAVISRRSYKGACSGAEALDTMQSEVDRGWRDPALFSVFRSVVARATDADDALAVEASVTPLESKIESKTAE
jgi:putative two-component system response regulator